MKKIGIISGSLRKGSYNRSVAQYAASLLEKRFQPIFIEFSDLPLYDQDLDEAPPAQWVKFREAVKNVDALLFVTPEYNRSIPGGLKNGLDVGSRPYGQSVWGGKPGGVISVSPGAIGGFGANHHLRQILSFLNVFTMQQPEAYLGNIGKALDENGNIVNEHTRKFIESYIDALVQWIEKF